MISTMKIVIASENPVKINATLSGFQQMFPDEQFEAIGVAVPSGVRDQPLSDSETYQGALNRADNAQKHMPEADFFAGLEGGLEEKDDDMESFAWIVIKTAAGKYSKGRTGTFFLPPAVAELIRGGKELGEADDIVFQQNNSKQAGGAVGILTNGVVDRTGYYTQAIIFALIPVKNPILFP